MTEDLARGYIEPHHGRIRSIFGAAWEHWLKIPDQQRGVLALHARSFANCLWAFIVFEAKTRFEGTNVHVKEKRGTITFSIANQVLLRFKKLSKKGLSSNYPTQAALQFNEPAQMVFFDEAVRVDCGYIMDKHGLGYEEFRIVRRSGKAIDWQYGIVGEGGEGESGIERPEQPIEGGPARGRVLPKQRTGSDDNGPSAA